MFHRVLSPPIPFSRVKERRFWLFFKLARTLSRWVARKPLRRSRPAEVGYVLWTREISVLSSIYTILSQGRIYRLTNFIVLHSALKFGSDWDHRRLRAILGRYRRPGGGRGAVLPQACVSPPPERTKRQEHHKYAGHARPAARCGNGQRGGVNSFCTSARERSLVLGWLPYLSTHFCVLVCHSEHAGAVVGVVNDQPVYIDESSDRLPARQARRLLLLGSMPCTLSSGSVPTSSCCSPILVLPVVQ